jgi:hypothetical protein
MDAGPHVDTGLVGVAVSLFLALKSLDVPVAGLADIVDNPGFAAFAGLCDPGAFTDGHVSNSYAKLRGAGLRLQCN